MAKTDERVLVNFRIDPQHRRLLKNAAKVRGTTMTGLVRSTLIPLARSIVLGEKDLDLEDLEDIDPRAKLSDEDVEELRELYASGQQTLDELGERFECTRTLAGYIVRGERRKRAPGPILDEDYKHPEGRGRGMM